MEEKREQDDMLAQEQQAGPQRAPTSDKDVVGETLRSFFTQVESEELPDRFKDLLKRLSEEEPRK